MFQIKGGCLESTRSWEFKKNDFKLNICSFNNKVMVVIAFAIPYISMSIQG
jgi:hypothetical protein